MSRPIKFNPDELAEKLNDYVKNTDNPMIQEFCVLNNVTKDTIYRLCQDNEKLSDSIKACHTKRELYIVRNTEQGNINATFSIFQLKQKCFGWTDKQEIVSDNTNTNVNIDADDSIREKLAEKLMGWKENK